MNENKKVFKFRFYNNKKFINFINFIFIYFILKLTQKLITF